MGPVEEQVTDALRILLCSWAVLVAYRTAKRAAENMGRWPALWRAVLWCSGIAVFAAASAGSPTCEGSDPISGDCVSYADDGYELTDDERIARFVFWALLLAVPAGFGIANRDLGRHLVQQLRKRDADAE